MSVREGAQSGMRRGGSRQVGVEPMLEVLEPRMLLDAGTLDLSSAWSTYVGGGEYTGSEEQAADVIADSQGNIIFTGGATSSNSATGGYDILANGDWDAYVMKLTPDGQIAWSTYLGGSQKDVGYGLTVDAQDNIYVVGETASPGWVPNGHDVTHKGGVDVFLAKFSPDGELLWASYYGGTSTDRGRGVDLDPDGNIYLAGDTNSSNWVSGGYDTSLGGYYDAFVMKLNAAGVPLWSCYQGGSDLEQAYGVACDNAGYAYVTGLTKSTGWINRGYDLSLGGAQDAFVLKFGPNGGRAWATYVGGSGNETGYSIAVDSQGNAVAAGGTYSAGWVSGNYDNSFEGAADGYAIKLGSDGQPLWSTYVGGTDHDLVRGVAVDADDNVLLIGEGFSRNWAVGGYDLNAGGYEDIILAKLDASGNHVWSSYQGGTSCDHGRGIAADADGNVLIVGYTGSSFWVWGGLARNVNTPHDFCVLRLHADSSPYWGTTLGGARDVEEAYDVATDGQGNVYIVGITRSWDWIEGGWDVSANGYYNGFLAKVSADGEHLWSTYLGIGTTPRAVGVDAWGNVFVTGSSDTGGWVSGGYDESFGGGDYDAFVIKLTPDGEHLWSSYLGADQSEFGYTLAVDPDGSVWLGGGTNSGSWIPGAEAVEGAYLVRLSAAGELVWSTLFTYQTYAISIRDIVVDAEGSVWIGGGTYASDWATQVHPASAEPGGGGFVAKLDASGAFAWSTVLRGYTPNSEWFSLTVGPDGSIVLGGNTTQAGQASGGYDTTYANLGDGLVSKLDGQGNHLWSTYIGGANYETLSGVTADASGNVLVTGYTKSAGWTSWGLDTTYNGSYDAFVVMLSPIGQHLWSTYLGGSASDYARGIAVDAEGSVLVAGHTTSSGWVSGGYNETLTGTDAFVVKLINVMPLQGDVNRDGCVDGYDLAVWQQNYDPIGTGFKTWEMGDWTADGRIDGADLACWQINYTAQDIPDPGISPLDRVWASYLGGDGEDFATDVAVGDDGSVYVVGRTGSNGLATPGAWDETYNGRNDAFIAKFDRTGRNLIYFTYLGTYGRETGLGIAVDAAGNAYITGYESYDDYAFVAKLDPTGSQLLYWVRLGSSGQQMGRDIAVDAAGNVYVTGLSDTGGLATPGAYDESHNGSNDILVAKLDAQGNMLACTYLGGDQADSAFGIALGTSGKVYVTGETWSDGWATAGAHDTVKDVYEDAFVAVLNADLSNLLWATYFGGDSSDRGRGIAVDEAENVYITGATYSANLATPGAFDTNSGIYGDAYIGRFDATGVLLWSTYLGGSNYDGGTSIAVNAEGDVFLGGVPRSFGMATPDAWKTDMVINSGYGFLARIDGDGSALRYFTYLEGGTNGLTLDAHGNAFAVGETERASWATDQAWDTTYAVGNGDAFVSRFIFYRNPADHNWDGKIDALDLAAWQLHYDPLGTQPCTRETGDFNGDGRVDSVDLALWQIGYNPLGEIGGY